MNVCGQKPSVWGRLKTCSRNSLGKVMFAVSLSGLTRFQRQWGLAHWRKSALRRVIKNLKSHLYTSRCLHCQGGWWSGIYHPWVILACLFSGFCSVSACFGGSHHCRDRSGPPICRTQVPPFVIEGGTRRSHRARPGPRDRGSDSPGCWRWHRAAGLGEDSRKADGPGVLSAPALTGLGAAFPAGQKEGSAACWGAGTMQGHLPV